MNSWKVLCTQSRFELKVEQQLSRLGIPNYLPKIKQYRQWSDRNKVISTPAFPGYIFVCTDEKKRNDVFNAKGALHYVRIENRDATIKEEEIKMIRLAESSISDTMMNKTQLRKGSHVKIIEGPLSGYRGELLEFMGKQKVALYIEEITIGFFIEIPIRYLRLI